MILGFEVVKVEMKCSLAINIGICCSHCCAEFRHFFESLIKGLDAVDKFNNSPTEVLTVCMNKDTTVFCSHSA
jgi:hypothetical protein